MINGALFGFYALVLIGLFLAARTAADAARRAGRPPFITAALAVATIVYISCTTPGWLGFFKTSVVWSLCFSLCVALIAVLPRRGTGGAIPASPSDPFLASFTAQDLALIVTGILFCPPFWRYFLLLLPTRLLAPGLPLDWDTVSYHLPAFVEFLQNGTLWSFEGPYQSYHYGFELLGNFLSHPFHTHWGLIVADGFSAIILIAGLYQTIAAAAPSLCRCPDRRTVFTIGASFAAVGIVGWFNFRTIGQIGKNDIFLAAVLFAALGFILRAANRAPHEPRARRGDLALAAAASGLALGTKPTALGFMPFFLAAAAVSDARRSAAALGRFGAVVFALGGGWLIRNLVEFGRLSPTGNPWRLSIFENLARLEFYRFHRWSFFFILAWLASPVGFYLCRSARRRGREIRPLFLLIAFHACAGAVYIFTPYVVFPDYWILRLGLPFFAASAVLFGLFAAEMADQASGGVRRGDGRIPFPLTRTMPVERLARAWRREWMRYARPIKRGWAVGLFAMMWALPLYWHWRRPAGLPGYEEVKGRRRTEIYAWIQALPAPARIYAAGLRPYGLYGLEWRNKVFYDLGSHGLHPLEAGIARIAAVTAQFNPDFIVISADPHPHRSEVEKPEVVAWLREKRAWFTERFSDDTVSVFGVGPEAADALRPMIPDGYIARPRG